MTKETYNIEIEVRDANGKIICDADGRKFISINLELTVSSELLLERQMKQIAESLTVWMPQNKLNIQASVFNSISGTWMCMYSYYVSEKRFVKHT